MLVNRGEKFLFAILVNFNILFTTFLVVYCGLVFGVD